MLRRVYRLPLLSEQHRTDDAAHAHRLHLLRATGPTSTPVSREIIDSLQMLTAEELAREGEALRFAKIGVVGNRERIVFNRSQALAFGLFYNKIVYQWKLPMVGQASGWMSEEEKEELYQHEPGMWGQFVAGAPAIINHNVGTDRGLVNGVYISPRYCFTPPFVSFLPRSYSCFS